jgi:hypothetical protein
MKRLFAILIALFSIGFACTSAVISGSATVDGRPLLWKHRDTGSLENKLVFISEKGYDFMGIANVKDPENKDIWMGVNEKGFAIMNTASYNINEGLSCDVEDDQEGLFMRLALETCANADDFEQLLTVSSGKWGVAANFGVIDAEGNAAYYETGYYDYTKFDATDPATAPNGYLIRTNFSITGKGDNGVGYIRFDATTDLFKDQEKISVDFILQQATRNMDHGLLKDDIGNMKLPKNFDDETLVDFQDYVVRYSSASVLVVQGVLPGEDPKKTVLWPIVGFPMTAMVTPVFYGNDIPAILTTNDTEAPFMPAASLRLKNELFPVGFDDKENYIDVAKLMNRKKTGYRQILKDAEKVIVEKFNSLGENPDEQVVNDYYQWLNNYVFEVYEPLLPAEKIKCDLPRCGEDVCE